MSLIKCPECQHEVSNRATHCIYCGCPLSDYGHPNTLPTDGDKITYSVVLQAYDSNAVIRLIAYLRQLTGASLTEAAAIKDNLPSIVVRQMTYAECAKIQQQFEELQATAIVVPDSEANETAHTAQPSPRLSSNPNTVSCPRCGSTQITTGQRGYKLLTGFLGSSKTVNRCANCGYKWEPSYWTRNK